MLQTTLQGTLGQKFWRDVRDKECFPQLSTRVTIRYGEPDDKDIKGKASEHEPVTFDPADITQYSRQKTDVYCDGGIFTLPYYQPDPSAFDSHLSHLSKNDPFGSYQVDNDQDQAVLMANKAASQLAFTRNEMEEVTSQGLDPGEWKQIASKTVRHRKNGNTLTVQSWARVYVAGTEDEEAVMIKGPPIQQSKSSTIGRKRAPKSGTAEHKRSLVTVSSSSIQKKRLTKRRAQRKTATSRASSADSRQVPGASCASHHSDVLAQAYVCTHIPNQWASNLASGTSQEPQGPIHPSENWHTTGYDNAIPVEIPQFIRRQSMSFSQALSPENENDEEEDADGSKDDTRY